MRKSSVLSLPLQLVIHGRTPLPILMDSYPSVMLMPNHPPQTKVALATHSFIKQKQVVPQFHSSPCVLKRIINKLVSQPEPKSACIFYVCGWERRTSFYTSFLLKKDAKIYIVCLMLKQNRNTRDQGSISSANQGSKQSSFWTDDFK